MKIENVPVVHYGEIIGKATIDEGDISITLKNPEGKDFADKLARSIEMGMVTALSIAPFAPPAIPGGQGVTVKFNRKMNYY